MNMSEFLKELRKEVPKMLQDIRDSEKRQRDGGVDYDEIHVRQSIVHSREDIALIAFWLGLLSAQLKNINLRLGIIITLISILILVLFLK